jgi:hypothetical protein
MSPLQISVQFALISLDNGYIVAGDTQLAAMQMGAQTGRLLIWGDLLLRIVEMQTVSVNAHRWISMRSRVV